MVEEKEASDILFVTQYTAVQGHIKGKLGDGVMVLRWTGSVLEVVSGPYTAANPSPCCASLSPDKNVLYVVSEAAPPKGFEGTTTSFKVEGDGSSLSFMNQQPSNGNATCSVTATPEGVYCANYLTGGVSSYTTTSSGELTIAQTLYHNPLWEADKVGNEGRQGDGAHAHMVIRHPSPSSPFLYAPDLGCDKIIQYKINSRGLLEHNNPPFVRGKPGSGPRHLAFHPSTAFAYASNELDCTITVFTCDATTGQLTEIQNTTTLHCAMGPAYSCSHVEVHHSGKCVVVANRGEGDDSLAVFPIDQVTGKVGVPNHTKCPGNKCFRHFTFHPNGKLLFVACQDSEYIAVYSFDEELLTLSQLPQAGITLNSPNYIQFL